MTFSFPTRGLFVALTLAFAGLGAACGDDDDDGGSSTCNNGKIDKGEQCDKTTFPAGTTCESASLGTKSGTGLKCSNQCRFDTSACTGGGGGSGGSGGASG
jgi:hypothetical protein